MCAHQSACPERVKAERGGEDYSAALSKYFNTRSRTEANKKERFLTGMPIF